MLRLLIFLVTLVVVSPSLFAQTFQGAGSFSLGMSTNASNVVLPTAINNLGLVGFWGVTAHGAKCDDTADDSAAINATIAAAVAAGGGTILFPAGKTCAIASTIAVTTSNIGFDCTAPASTQQRFAADASCQLKWIGSAGGRMMSIIAPYGVSTDTRLYGNFVRHLTFNGNGLAADGLYLQSLKHFDITTVGFVGEFDGGNVLTLDADPTPSNSPTFGDATDIQNGTITDVEINTTGTSGGILLNKYMNPADGTGGNASYNTIIGLFINVPSSVTAINCNGCDNNTVIDYRIFDSGTSIKFGVATDGTHYFGANGNRFVHGYYSGKALAVGQTSVPGCTAFTWPVPANACSHWNVLYDIDEGNGTPNPTVEPGADLHWTTSQGALYGELASSNGVQPAFIIADDPTTTRLCRNDAVANAADGTLYLCNSANSSLLMIDNIHSGASTDRFGWALTGTNGAATLELSHPAGTGKIQIDDGVILNGGGLVSSDAVLNATCAADAATNQPDGGFYGCNNSGTDIIDFERTSAGAAVDRFNIRLNGTAGAANLQFRHPTGSGWLESATPIQLDPLNVSAVAPLCNSTTEGMLAAVTNSTTATWGATITAGGTNHVLAYCDGTNLTVAGM